MTITIWSFRTSPARGNYVVAERQCDETEALAWLKIFRDDEPTVLFVGSKRKPRA